MAPMIVSCAGCAAQNFVSSERIAVAEPPPRCWKCGEPLPAGGSETVSGAKESKKGAKPAENPGGLTDV
ncbi:MAG: hypothetical protein HZA60_08000 [Deltaproteobacteria bacterium]|nr:hypothetical protein [Deltaproteobacteria bacterium]